MSARRAPGRRRQRGVAAIELALILPILLAMLAFPLFFGRVFWHYTVAAKAAHDGARYLSTVPSAAMTTATGAGYAVEVAQAIVAADIGDLNPGPDPVTVAPECDGGLCNGYSTPATVTLIVQVPVYDIFFNDLTWQAVGDKGLLLTARATMSYVGK